MSAPAPAGAPVASPHHAQGHHFTLALVGNPNAGKTTLFNALTGLRAKTANFAGTTIERKVGRMEAGGHPIIVVDLPGLYSMDSTSPDERVAADALRGRLDGHPRPDAVLLVIDATNLERNLFLVSQVLELQIPTLVALNMMDMAEAQRIVIDPLKLRAELGCEVIAISARTGSGLDEVRGALARLASDREEPIAFLPPKPSCAGGCAGCPFEARYAWTEDVTSRCTAHNHAARSERTDRLDEWLTHPVIGIVAFLAVMLAVFFLIFQVASIPMDLIDGLFADLAVAVARALPDSLWSSLIVDGVIRGVGGILVFLPQICILFFVLSLLDDTGYFSRAAFVMDRLMSRIGLPGKAFVPLLSAHACALPAIMSTRVIEDPRDRLVTILVAPLMTCSARIPVYAMVVALLFPKDPAYAALTFVGAYVLGITAALTMAWLFKRTILPGQSKPLLLELPPYRMPSLRTALLQMLDRASVFVKTAGTTILIISIALWFLASFPRAPVSAEVTAMETEAATLSAQDRPGEAGEKLSAAHDLQARQQLEHSLAGRVGRFIEPALKPLGFDWQIGIGIVSSFAAREVIVSTLAVVYGVGADHAEENADSLYDTLRAARRSNGMPVFNVANCFSLLVFYVLAAQCLPTQAVVRRETKTWKWPAFQLFYMTALAYVAALAVYQVLAHLGFG